MARPIGLIEAMFTGLIAFYRRTLDIALRYHFITLLVFLGTVSLSVYLYIIIPKGFFPPQDNGIVLGITEARQDISFKEMMNVQQRLADIVAQDPGYRRRTSPRWAAGLRARPTTRDGCSSR